MKAPAPSERQIQRAIIAELGMRLKPGCWLTHVPNGGSRSAREGLALRLDGVRAGTPDLIILVPCAPAITIEVKSKSGTLSPSQKVFQGEAIEHGHRHIIVRSAEEAVRACREWGVLKGGEA